MRGGNYGSCVNPCLTMHQPWASLLVHGIKRVEGRSWPAPLRGRLWIHAAGKVPDAATIKAMEDFYREIYAVNGIADLKFPERYPVSRLLGCVEVVGCVRGGELASWEKVPEGVRLEGQTDFCWLCEQPQKLLVPIEMKGNQGVYELERKRYEAAVGGLVPVESPLPVKFPLPHLQDPFSLKPGSISAKFPESKASELEKSSSLSTAIAGARAAATQFLKKNQNFQNKSFQTGKILSSGQWRNLSMEEDKMSAGNLDGRSNKLTSGFKNKGQSSRFECEGYSSGHNQISHTDLKPCSGAPAKIFAAAVRGLRPS